MSESVDSDGVVIQRPFVRSAYNYDRDAASVASGLLCTDKTRTQQQFKDECDINTIIERFGLGYRMPEGARIPSYGDFVGIDDYQTAVNAVLEAGERFDLLPANIRERFYNDPGHLIAFMQDERNREEAVRLGLIPAPSGGQAAAGVVVPITSPASGTSSAAPVPPPPSPQVT